MTVYYKLDHSEPGYLSQMLPRADGSWVKRADYEADLAAARAEIERLTKARDNLSRLEQSHREQANAQFHRAEKAEDENHRLREVLKKIASTGRCDFAEVRAVLKKAHVEIERMKPMVIDWDGVRTIMDSDDVIWVHGDDYASAVKERDEALAQVADAFEAAARWHDDVAAHDQSGIDYSDAVGIPISNRANLAESVRQHEYSAQAIRALTPADAKAALEAYGREKMKEGMQRAADIVEDYCADDPMLAGHGYSASIRDAILNEMEHLK